MPRTVQQLIDHASTLAASDEVRSRELALLRRAVIRVAMAEQELVDTVRECRRADHSWATLGATLGTSGEAARAKYGP